MVQIAIGDEGNEFPIPDILAKGKTKVKSRKQKRKEKKKRKNIGTKKKGR